jgi:hypothetical protein
MVNPKGKKLEKLLFGLFDDAIKNVDIYNHHGSLWLIFTDEMKWVVEYTKSQTLWYNYNFFKNEMEIVGFDCVENKDFIQKWFEYRFLNMNTVEDTIQNGVKETISNVHPYPKEVRDTIQNGVKRVDADYEGYTRIEDTIENGVKHTEWNGSELPTHKVEDAIKNGVKETKTMAVDRIPLIKKVFQNGVKEVEYYNGDAEVLVNEAIENGVKEVMNGTIQVFLVSDIIKNGVKKIRRLDVTLKDEIGDIIKNGVKEIHDDIYHHKPRIEGIISNGKKIV